MKRVIFLPIIILAFLALLGWAFGPSVPVPAAVPSQLPASAVQAYLQPVAQSGSAPVRDTTVADPVLDANAAMLMHLESGRVLFEKNAHTKVPIASLTKLLSALVAQDLFLADESITVASGSVRVDGQRQTLYLGERILVRDLVAMMLVESSNDAAYALAAYARDRGVDFIGKMNEKAWVLGMHDCTFTDPAGLDDEAFCTADDLARLARAALRSAPQLWPVMASPLVQVRSADGKIVHEVKSTNELLGRIPGIIGGKTGHTDGALGCLLLVVETREGHDTLVSIVLGSRARFVDTSALLDWSTLAWRWD